jgi:transcription initiation protein SPT3
LYKADRDEIEDTAAGAMRIPAAALPWDISSFFSEKVPYDEEHDALNSNEASLERLRKADEKTKHMTTQEYITWSESRHASFTWRKAKRFRQWSGLGIIADHKPADDVLDIFGFLTYEMVQTLTEVALTIQEDSRKCESRRDSGTTARGAVSDSLFSPPHEFRSPVEPRHIRQAFERLQRKTRSHGMLNGVRFREQDSLKLVGLQTWIFATDIRSQLTYSPQI